MTKERINVRELVKQFVSASEKSGLEHVHCKPLHLPAAEAQIFGDTKTPSAAHKGELIAGLHGGCPNPCKGVRIVVAHRASDIGVESIRKLIDEVCCATEMCGFANLIVVMCQSGVAKSNVLAYLGVRKVSLFWAMRGTKLTERGKCE